MTISYLNASAETMLASLDEGKCAWCGNDPDPCFCRYCDSCSEYWLDSERRDYVDGRPSMKVCPDCQESEAT